jgi:hypothetical protein
MKVVASSRLRFLSAILLVAVLVVAAALTATGRAGSVRVSVGVQISPHVLTAGERGVITIKFFNAGPSTVNHASATVSASTGPLPLPASAFASFTLPSGCAVVGTTSTTITCDLGQVAPGTVRRMISFTAPAAVASFSVHVAASFDEGKNTGLTDTVTGDDPFPFSLATGTSTKGQCTDSGGSLTAGDSVQQTGITYGALPSSMLPCTPVSVGVNATLGPNNVAHPFGEVSFVDFLDGGGLATVKVYLFTTPQGVTKKNLALYELARFPIDLTATNGGAAVPMCVTVSGALQIPADSGFISCVVRVDTLPGGGLVATLLAKGGDDGGWGGIS